MKRLPKSVRVIMGTAVPGVNAYRRMPAVYRRSVLGLCAAKRTGRWPKAESWCIIHVPSGFVAVRGMSKARAVTLLAELDGACDWTRSREDVAADQKARKAVDRAYAKTRRKS